MSDIEWRQVSGFPGYEVSSAGEVRSFKRMVPKVLKPRANPKNGYLTVTLMKGAGKKRNAKHIHRLVAAAFHGDPPDGMECRHIDGDKMNNTAANLRWGTRLENIADTIRHGNHHSGSKEVCKNGHPYDDHNTIRYVASDTNRWRRRCRSCCRRWNAEAAERRRQTILQSNRREA